MSSVPTSSKYVTSSTVYYHNVELFGESEKLNGDRLPTYGEVLKHYFFMFEELLGKQSNTSLKDVTPYVTDTILEIWQKLPLAIIERKSIYNKLDRFINQYKKLTKNTKCDDLQQFVVLLKNLFSVAKCSCNLITSNCTCGNTQLFIKSFMVDQQTDRHHTISGFLETLPPPSTITTVRTQGNTLDEAWQPPQVDAIAMDVIDTDLESEVTVRRSYNKRLPLSNFAMECDRHGVSHQTAAAIASALMKDLDIKDNNGKTLVIDKNKVQRERNRLRNEVLKKRFDASTLLAFSFDSRKDETLVTEIVNNKPHIRKIKEPHMVVLREPESRFIGHIVLEGETAATKTKQLIRFFDTNGIPLDNLVAIVCSDGEPVNTGLKGGIIRLFEQHLNRELHWSVCLLHFNELPFRHLFDTLEKSTTKGPRTSTGQLSNLLDICDTLQVVQTFEMITLENMPPSTLDFNSLSTDAKNLIELANAISNSTVSADLASKKMGPLHHARWLTKSARILRVYIATDKPTNNLKILAIYVMKVYIPMYFNVKYYYSIEYGCVLLFKFIQWIKYLPPYLLTVVQKVVEDYNFFGNSESILLSMLYDENESIRHA